MSQLTGCSAERAAHVPVQGYYSVCVGLRDAGCRDRLPRAGEGGGEAVMPSPCRRPRRCMRGGAGDGEAPGGDGDGGVGGVRGARVCPVDTPRAFAFRRQKDARCLKGGVGLGGGGATLS